MDGVAKNGNSMDEECNFNVVGAVTAMDATDAATAAAQINHAICVNDKLGRLVAAVEVTVCVGG